MKNLSLEEVLYIKSSQRELVGFGLGVASGGLGKEDIKNFIITQKM